VTAADRTAGPTGIGWFTTLPHPFKKAHTHGADDGQVGWRLHAVPISQEGIPEKRAKPLCGQHPRHGWGMDMFIDQECSRCLAAIWKREARNEVFIDVPKARAKARAAAWGDGSKAALYGKDRSANPHPAASHLHAEWLRGFDEVCPDDAAFAKADGDAVGVKSGGAA